MICVDRFSISLGAAGGQASNGWRRRISSVDGPL